MSGYFNDLLEKQRKEILDEAKKSQSGSFASKSTAGLEGKLPGFGALKGTGLVLNPTEDHLKALRGEKEWQRGRVDGKYELRKKQLENQAEAEQNEYMDPYNVWLRSQNQPDNPLVQTLLGYADWLRNNPSTVELNQHIAPELEKRKQEEASKLAGWSADHPILSSGASVATSLLSGGDYIARLVEQATIGKTMNTPTLTATEATQAIRGGVTEDHNKVDKFLYNTAMSGIDSLVASLGGGGGAVLLGLSAASNTYNDVKARGGTEEQALIGGAVSGAFESLFEKISIGNINALKEIPVDSAKTLIVNALKSSGVNLTEEALTEVANITYDYIAMGDLSHYAIAVKEYEAQYIADGMTPEEAKAKAEKQAVADMAKQVGEAALSGALMGPGFTAVGAVASEVNAYNTGKDLKNRSEQYDLVQLALQGDKNSRSYKMADSIATKLDSSDTAQVSSREIGRLHNMMDFEAAQANEKAERAERSEQLKTTLADIFKPNKANQAKISAKDNATSNPVKSRPATEVEQVAAVQESHPDVAVVPNSVSLFMEAGDDSTTAARKAEILARITSGDTSITNSQLRKLDMQSQATRAVLQQITGQTVPQTTDTKTLLDFAHSLVDQYAQVNAEQAALQSQIEAVAAEAAAIAQTAEAQVAQQAQQDNVPVGQQQVSDVPVRLSDGTSVTKAEFISRYKAANLGKSEASAQTKYADAVRSNQLGMSYPASVLQKADSAAQGSAGTQKRGIADTAKGKSQSRSESSTVASSGNPTKEQEWTVKHINSVLAKRDGAPKVVLGYDLAENENGYYDRGTNTIVLNGNKLTTQFALTYTLSHELVHSVSDEQRTELVDDIYALGEKIYGADKMQHKLDGVREAYIRNAIRKEGITRVAAEAKVDITYAKEELAADIMRDLMSSTGGLNRLANERKSLLDKLIDTAERFMRTLKGDRSTEAKSLYNEAEALVDRMLRAQRSANAELKNEQKRGTLETDKRNSLDKLTDDEVGAVLRYKSSESYKINAKLREGEALDSDEQSFVDSLDAALAKLPVKRGTVYRNIGFDWFGEDAYNAFMREHKENEFIVYTAYTSASVSEDGYPVEEESRVSMVIESVSARDVEGLGNNFESEVIFPRDTVFVVNKVGYDTNGKPIITMQEVAADGQTEQRNNGQLHPEERGEVLQSVQASDSVHRDMQGISERDSGGRGDVENAARQTDSRGQRDSVRAEVNTPETRLSAEADRGVSSMPETGEQRFSLDNGEYAPAFYSHMERVVEGIKQDKLGASTVIQTLRNKGVKADEIKWTGIEKFLEGKKSVTKQELLDYLRENAFELDEKELAIRDMETPEQKRRLLELGSEDNRLRSELNAAWRERFGHSAPPDLLWSSDPEGSLTEYIDPADPAFEQILATLTGIYDVVKERSKIIRNVPTQEKADLPRWHEYAFSGGSNYREYMFQIPGSEYTNDAMTRHWDDNTGVLAHARVQDFIVNGEKVMLIEEIQSDWHNAGQKVGYGDIVPDAPYSRTYHEYVLKNLLRKAAEGGYTYIAWPTAEQMLDRWNPKRNTNAELQIASKRPDAVAFEEGYKIEYDQDIPKFLDKYTKSWGGKTGYIDLGVSDYDSDKDTVVHSLKLTDALKNAVLFEGQTRYSIDKEAKKTKTGGNTGNVNPDTGYERGSVADSFMRIWNTGDREAALNVLEQTVQRLSEMEAEQAEKRKRDTLNATFRPAGQLTEDTIARNKRVIEELIAKYGKMEQTSAAQQEVRLPKKRDDKTKVRGFMQTAAAAEVTTEAVLNEFERAIVEGDAGATYVPIGDQGTLRRATEALEKEGFDSLLTQWESKFDAGDTLTKDDIAKAEQLYVEACNNRDTITAMKLAAQISVAGTQAGQAVQALTLLKKMTPSGNLYYIQKAVDRLNKEQKGKHKDIVINEQLAKRLLEAETQEEIQAALDAICQDLADQMPVTLMDKWNTWRYLAMLGNPRTHIRNLMGNAVFTPARLMKDMLAATMELTLPVEQRTKAFTVSAELRDFAKQDAEAMKDILRGGGKYNPADMIRDKRRIFRSGVLNAAEQFNSSMLEAEDWLFLKSAYSRALGSFLSARGTTVDAVSGANSTVEGRALLEEARAYAVKEAQKATYRDMSKVAGTINHLKRNTGLVGEVFLEGMVPFTKTPINIVKRGIEYSPAGLIKGIVDMGTKVRKGDMRAAEALDEMCAGLTGTGILLLGSLLTHLGILVPGHGDDDEDEFDELQGIQEYSLRIGDLTFTIDWTAPVALPLFVGSEIYTVLAADADEDVNVLDAILDGVTTMFEPMLSLSMLDGLNKTLSANKYGEEDDALYNILATVATSYFSQGVPTLFGQIARTVDDSRRVSFTPKGAGKIESWLSRAFQTNVQGKIPVAAEGRMLYIDNWGRADTESNILMRAFENFISPGYIDSVKTTAVDAEIERLAEATGDNGVFPDRAAKYFSVDKETYAMTQEEYQAHLIERGQHSYQLVNDIINSPMYAGLDDSVKAQAISLAYEYASGIAKLHTNADYDPDLWMLNLQALETGGGDAAEYLLLRAQSKVGGYSLTENALSNGSLSSADVVNIAVMETNMPDSFTDPYTTGYEYVLTDEYKAQYESLYRQYLAEEYAYLIEDREYQQASASEKYEMFKDIKTKVGKLTREAMSDRLWDQGVEPTPKG